MQQSSALLALLLLSAAGVLADARRSASASSRRVVAGSPVEQVVTLLKDLKSKIEQDGENEQKAYDKYACFCDKAMKSKADAIDTAKLQIRTSGQEILKLRGRVATRTAEISELAEAILENEEMRAERTSIRQRENGEYMGEAAEMKEALDALEKATIIIKNATMPALLQTSGAASASAARVAAATARVIKALPIKAALAPEQLKALRSFSQVRQGYAPQSLTVQGILTDMYDTFSSDLETSTENEARNNREYEQFIALKVNESQEMQNVKSDKETDKAHSEQLLAEETSLYDATEAQMHADISYFDVTKDGCEAKFYEWGNRSALRTDEVQGIDEALAILTTDDARALFSSAIKPGKETRADASYDAGLNLTSFLQTGNAQDVDAPIARAYALLKAQATGAHSLRLAQLAVNVRETKLGHFDEVIQSIDGMIATLQEEDAADIAKRDQCKSEYQKIASTVADLEWKIRNNEAKINKLEDMIQQRDVEKTQTIADIDAVQDQMQAMTAQRTSENQDFLSAKREDQDAIHLLDQAKAVLSKYYNENEIDMGPIQGSVKGLALQQRQPAFEVSEFEAPDTTFSNKGSRKGQAKNIVSVLTMLIEDLTDEIRNGMKDEAAAQQQYESAMEAAEQLEADLKAKKLSLEEAIARLTTEKGEEENKKSGNEAEHQDEVDYKARITPDCDWIIGAFEGRAERRVAELQGLRGAKDFLVGANEAALLQQGGHRAKAFDDAALAKVRFLGLSA